MTVVEAHIPTHLPWCTLYSGLGLLVNGLTNDNLCLIDSIYSKLIALQWVLRIRSFLAEVRSFVISKKKKKNFRESDISLPQLLRPVVSHLLGGWVVGGILPQIGSDRSEFKTPKNTLIDFF